MIDPALIVPRPAGLGAVILAGGRARRLGGGDKGRIDILGHSILSRQIATLRPQVAALALNANGPADRFIDSGLPVLPDPQGAAGPLAGLLAGLDWAAGMGFERVLSVPCDTPFLPVDLAMRLGRGGPAIAASMGRVHPVIGMWPVELRNALRRFVVDEDGRKAATWAERCGAIAVEWPEDPFFNLNGEDDRPQAEALARSITRRGAAIVLPAGETAQELLETIVDEVRARGARVGGLIQRGRKGDAVLVALDSGESLPIMQKLGQSKSCAVDQSAVTDACAVVRRAVERRDDLIIVNKFGPLEADRSGLADEMVAAMAEGLSLLTTVTLDRVEAWLAFTGGCCNLLPADLDAVRRWWDGPPAPSAR